MKIRVLAMDGDWSDGMARLVAEFLHAGAERELTTVDLAREVRAAERAAETEILGAGSVAGSTYTLPADLAAPVAEIRGAAGGGIQGKAPAAKRTVARPATKNDGLSHLQERPRTITEAVKAECIEVLKARPLTSVQIIGLLKPKGRTAAQVYPALKELRDTKAIETRNDENLEKRNYLLS